MGHTHKDRKDRKVGKFPRVRIKRNAETQPHADERFKESDRSKRQRWEDDGEIWEDPDPWGIGNDLD